MSSLMVAITRKLRSWLTNSRTGFAAQIIIAFGLVTELPLVIVILAALGVVTPQFLARNRRYAVVLSAVEVLTGPDEPLTVSGRGPR